MAGTKAGGKLAAQTNKAKHGADFYAKIGAEGGKKGRTGGFYKTMCNCSYRPQEHKKAECAGYKGGLVVSKRRK